MRQCVYSGDAVRQVAESEPSSRVFDYLYVSNILTERELSNNLAENSMRGVALGRKNWIHIGSPMAGPPVAAILSVTETCRRLGIPVREYLASVLPGTADTRIQTLARLTPAVWATRNC